MILKTPLFPGKNFVHQLSLIFDVIGSPLPKEIEHIKNSQAKKFLDSQLNKSKVPLENIFSRSSKVASKEAIHLLENLLLFSPSDRFTASNALNSSYLCDVPVPSISKINPPLSAECNFNFEKVNSNHLIKEMILLEISSLKKASSPSLVSSTTTTTAAAISINQHNNINNNNNDLSSDEKLYNNNNKNNNNYNDNKDKPRNQDSIKANIENDSNLKKNVVPSYKENNNGFKLIK